MELTYRAPTVEETQRVWKMMNALDHETRYMLFEPGERPQECSRLEGVIRTAQSGGFFCCAWDEDTPVGFASAERGDAKRVRHSAYVVTGIRQNWRGQGVGTELFRRMEEWARAQGVTRLELTVVAENTNAIGLYEKCGFVREGVKRRSILLDGRYADELYMGKLLDDEIESPAR